jgi:hypothetical protein
VGWVVNVLKHAALRAGEQGYPGGEDMIMLAGQTPETLAKNLSAASTGIKRAARNPGAGTP